MKLDHILELISAEYIEKAIINKNGIEGKKLEELINYYLFGNKMGEIR